MSRKHYGQACPIARALDVLGDRWTLLILRELLGGPAHFGDLEGGLHGVPKNLLSQRLKRLEADGLVRRTKDAGGHSYGLTPQGAGVRPALEDLAFWGAGIAPIAPPTSRRSVRAIAMALQAILGRGSGWQPERRTVIEVDVDDEAVEFVLGPEPSVTVRPVSESSAVLRTTRNALAGYLDRGELSRESLDLVSGTPDAASQLLRALGA